MILLYIHYSIFDNFLVIIIILSNLTDLLFASINRKCTSSNPILKNSYLKLTKQFYVVLFSRNNGRTHSYATQAAIEYSWIIYFTSTSKT